MTQSEQADLFGPAGQGDLFGPPPKQSYVPKPEKVREQLLAMLAQARAAQIMPWKQKEALLYRKIFPQMANWLPEEEAAQLRLEFETQLVRLKAA